MKSAAMARETETVMIVFKGFGFLFSSKGGNLGANSEIK